MVRIAVLAINTGTPVKQQTERQHKNIKEDGNPIGAARRRGLSEHESVASLALCSAATLQHDLEAHVREHDLREEAPVDTMRRHDLEEDMRDKDL